MAPTPLSTVDPAKIKVGSTLMAKARVSKSRKSKAGPTLHGGQDLRGVFKVTKKTAGSGSVSKLFQGNIHPGIKDSDALAFGLLKKEEGKDEVNYINDDHVNDGSGNINAKKKVVKARNSKSIYDDYSPREIEGARLWAEHAGRKKIKLEDLEMARVFNLRPTYGN